MSWPANCRRAGRCRWWCRGSANDLRVGECSVRPEGRADRRSTATAMPWRVSGLGRGSGRAGAAGRRPAGLWRNAGRCLGGRGDRARWPARGLAVMFYPFVLMEQMAGNALPEPLFRRGRPAGAAVARADHHDRWRRGVAGSPDGTAAAEAEVAAFFGTAAAGGFRGDSGGVVGYSGPAEFALPPVHPALRASVRGGGRGGGVLRRVGVARDHADPGRGRDVSGGGGAAGTGGRGAGDPAGREDRLCRGLDRIFRLSAAGRDGRRAVPSRSAVDRSRTSISSASTTTCRWRTGATATDHADAGLGQRLQPRLPEGQRRGRRGVSTGITTRPRRARCSCGRRSPMAPTASPGSFATRTCSGWWSNPHHDRIGGVRDEADTGWVPGMKPIWFTELGCAAIDKGANQPNKFLDPKSSELVLPYYSNGRRDDVMQMQYLRAIHALLGRSGRITRCRRNMPGRWWTWTAPSSGPGTRGRFRRSRTGATCGRMATNYARGHWLNGRAVGAVAGLGAWPRSAARPG